MLRGWQDFVQVDGDTEGDEEEAADAGADPVWGLEWGWGNELGPEGVAAFAEEHGARGFEVGGGYAGDVVRGVNGVDVGLSGCCDGVGGGEGGEVKDRRTW